MTYVSDDALRRLRGAAAVPDLAGTRYHLLEEIGRGGMGVVYLAEDATLGRHLALKVLDLPDQSGGLSARLLREARILARLEHPGIVPVHDVGELPDGRVFYTMKFVQGRRLDQHFGQLDSLPDRLRIFQRICEPVAFANSRGVLHRDLKPENIMVGPFGEVLVMDWGVAKILRDAGADDARPAVPNPSLSVAPARPAGTAHGAVLGTPGYMAPEQARGEVERLDERADVFALGVILRFLSDGNAPADAATQPQTQKAGLPRPLAAICAKATSRDPAGRYASAQELSDEVARFLDGLPVSAYPEGIFARAARLISRNKTAVALVLAYLLMRAFLLIFARR